MLVRLKLYRDHDFVIKEFVVPTEPGQTLLDVLFYIKRSTTQPSPLEVCAGLVYAEPVE
jgi:hypothetical protein